MKTVESIYKCVVEPSYKKSTLADANRDGHIRHKRGESTSSWTSPKKGESNENSRKRHVDSPTGK